MTREEAIKTLRELWRETYDSWYESVYVMAIEALQREDRFLKSMDTNEPLYTEVVRCKDCKHKVVTEDGEYDPEDIVCEYWMSDGLNSNDYCSYGERKE